MKRILIPVAAVALCLTFGLALGAGCVISTGSSWFQDWSVREKATRSETHALSLVAGGKLTIDLNGGDIDLTAGGTEAPDVTAMITSFGRTAELAKKALEGTRLVVESTGDGTRIHFEADDVDQGHEGVHVVIASRADLTLRVPKDLRLVFVTGTGHIKTHGPIASSELHSRYGDVQVDEASGDQVLESDSGKVTLDALHGARSLSAQSKYGEVSARNVEATKIDLQSSSGDVRLEDAQCETAKLDSKYGAISVSRVSGEVDAKTSSGNVEAQDLGGHSAHLQSGYGDVRLQGFKGTLTASTQSGSIAVAGFEGACEAKSGYGDVVIEGRIGRISGASKSGSVRVRALDGSIADGDWKLVSGYGDVSLRVPKDQGFDLDARTSYGTLDVQVPVLVEAGGMKDKKGMRGKIGTGGHALELATSSGNVHLTTTQQP